MKAKSLLSIIPMVVIYQLITPACPNDDEQWLKRQTAFERDYVVGRVENDFRGDNVFQGPGKAITLEYVHQYYTRDEMSVSSDVVEARLQPVMRILAQRPEAVQYTKRGIKIIVNFYSRDRRLIATLTI